MLYQVRGSFEMVRWRHAFAVVPVKSLYLYTYHCTSAHTTSACYQPHLNRNVKMRVEGGINNQQLSETWPLLVPKTMQLTSRDQRPENLMCINQQCMVYAKTLRNLNHQSSQYNTLQIKTKKQKLYYDNLSLVESYLSNNSVETFLKNNDFAIGVKTLYFSYNKDSAKKYSDEEGKQPADDPTQKIRVLAQKIKTETPMLFQKVDCYHDFSMYTNNIELYVALKKIRYSLSGIRKYKFVVSLFRRLQLWYLSRPDLEILSVNTNEEQSTIEVRWRTTGWTPLAIITTVVFRMPSTQSYFDFSSTLYVNKEGSIWRHDVNKLHHHRDRIPLRSRLKELKKNTVGTVAAIASQVSPNPFRTKYTLHAKNNHD